MARREYTAGRPTTLTAALSIGATSFTIADATNWPTSTDYDFWVTVDGGTAQEERILCSARTGTTVTVASRGADGTTESNHSAGATIWPSWSATDADEANAHINSTTNIHGVSGSIAPLAGPTFTGTVVLPSTTSIGNASSTEIGYLDGVTSAIQTQLNTNTLVGSITMWPVSTVPAGWLECNGQSTSGYTALAAVVGATVPDMQGLVPVGFKTSDDAFGTLKGTGGSKTSTAAHTHNLASHTHTINHDHGAFDTVGGEGGHAHSVGLKDGASEASSKLLAGASSTSGIFLNRPVVTGASTGTSTDGAHNHNVNVPDFAGTSGGPSDNTSGGSSVGATNGNLQPYFTLKFIIKT
jgi:microcystin-dependent protein